MIGYSRIFPLINLLMQKDLLKRDLSLVDVVALGLNGVIGTGIFLLPGRVTALLGPAAALTFLIAGFMSAVVVLCFAEVGSRFSGTGGPMLYSRAAFGDAAGFFVGWITWVIRITGWGALANALVVVGEALLPAAADFRVLVITGLIGVLTAINIAGVGAGARVTNFFTVAKLVPIAIFIGFGVFHIDADLFTPFAPNGLSQTAPATLIILYAFVGFEALSVPAGEMRDPTRSVPRALILVMVIVVVVYLLIWVVTTGTLPTLAESENPVVDAARVFMGPVGAKLIGIGVFLSVLGINSGTALVAPRSLYALSKEGYLPPFVSWVHPTRRTPIMAILLTSVISLTVALSGSFVQLAVISVVARLAQYIPTCVAVLYFRATRPDDPPPFRAPLGPIVPVLAIALCLWLLIAAESSQLLWGIFALVSGGVIYLPTRLARARAKQR